MISKLPLSKDQAVLDLGCGPGVVANLLAERVSRVIGVDINAKLVETARKQGRSNTEFLQGDIKDISWVDTGEVDGIWSSFTAAYFYNFGNVLKNWLKGLKSGGWIALIEVADLFLGHEPLPKNTYTNLAKLSNYMRDSQTYDVDMGNKLSSIMKSTGLKEVKEYDWEDKELSFQGPASNEVLEAWSQRFDRLSAMPHLFDEVTRQKIKMDFLDCLSSPNHTSSSKIIMITAKK